MNVAAQYRNWDTKKAPGVYVTFEREIIEDADNPQPDDRDEGFWPSHDKSAAGYVPPEDFQAEHELAKARMAAWSRGDWHYVGVRARATVTIVHKSGHAIAYELFSAGCWGVESDAGDYLNDLFKEECAALLVDIKAFGEAQAV